MDFFDFLRFADVSPAVVVITVILVIFLGIHFYVSREREYLPGPWGLPYIGYWPYLKGDSPHLHLQDLMKKYGDVYSMRVMGQLFIHLGTLKVIKETHVTMADCFAKRYSLFSVLSFLFDEGIACLNGDPWKVQRKFFVQAFKDLGMTNMKDYMAGPIYDSIMSTVQSLKKENGKPVNIISILNDQCSAILRRTMFNDEGITNQELKDLAETYGKVTTIFSGTTFLMGEIARRVLFPLNPNYKLSLENHKIMVDILKKIVKRHEETFDKDNIRDVIDSYIKERKERESKNDPTSKYFTEKSLISNLIQFVGDGSLGISGFIGFFIEALVEHPEEQDKMFSELEEVLGTDRQPTLDDKSKLPYTNAFIQEVIRTCSFFLLFPDLECTQETTLNGYKVPKGAITVLNLWSSHRDPKTYEDPDEFKPSRYISEPGKPKAELPILFGVGKRSCAGESFAMMEVFLFLTTIVKNFRLTRSEGFVQKSLLDVSMEISAHPNSD